MTADDVEAICLAATARIRAGDAAGGAAILAEPLQAMPQEPRLLHAAGNCALARGDEETAIEFYRRSVAAAPDAAASLANLGFLLRIRQQLDEARAVLRRAVAIAPQDVLPWVNLVSTYVNEGEPAIGEAVAREALRRHPGNAALRWNLSLLLLEQGRWEAGWKEYRHRFDAGVCTSPPAFAGLPRLEDPGQLAQGHHVFCHGEQGLGDEILFVGLLDEFLADAGRRGTTVSLAPNPRLAGICRRTWHPRLQIADATGGGSPRNRSGVWQIPIGDLARFYRTSDDAFPMHRGYLATDREAVARLRTALGGGSTSRRIVGIAWRGGSSYTHAMHRTTALADWLPVLRQDATFVSLAYHDDSAERAHLHATYGLELITIPEITLARDYERTCELVAALDLVITVPTSVHHVAGAIGTPCWLMMHERSAWRECSRDAGLPWYPHTHRRFVRTTLEADWRPVMDRVADALATRSLLE